ncbi:hypothetical protein TNIN_63231 [Trichonephila inaurata madagascariensis]|uniref:Uncharacterized protein n=1 Tax=Trichonephila inaurata madagascariensis TaxID=2747483 RepID=A0A8X6WN20_9ARAC|nr:hypothetical protein TNIN_63231 [Trichonephila inaurata madagascariensis]
MLLLNSQITEKFARDLVEMAQFDFTTVHQSDNNTLVRVKDNKSKSFAFAIPKAMIEQTLIASHDDVRLMNAKKTITSCTVRDLLLYYWPKQGDPKLSPTFKGPFVIICPVGAVCYELKSTTHTQKTFIKVVDVQHLYLYFKRDTDFQNNSHEENDSSAENQDPAEDLQEIFVITGPSPNQHYLHHNRRLQNDLNNMFL